MPDPTYQPLIYRRQGGTVQVVARGGQTVIETPVIAGAGTTTADATVITDQQVVVTGGDGTVGVRLPVGEIGSTITVHNASASVLKVYPDTGGAINGAAADAAFSLAANARATFVCTAALVWYAPTATAGVTSGVAGVAGGYKIARGVHTQVAAADTVVTGLTTVVAVVAQFDSAPTVKQLHVRATIGNQAGAPAAGSIIISTYKPTSNVNDSTPTAATDFTENLGIAWIAVGT